ncbi:hypothetical protein [Pseudonocardia phyllosphaerae]|uniref:hypothetical protein n=1 Tax=Pseudonocardia phyllosphaerae TaxID=3390502 RepID=UPI00397A711E
MTSPGRTPTTRRPGDSPGHPAEPSPEPIRWWRPALAALVVVLLVAGTVIAFAVPRSAPPPAGAPAAQPRDGAPTAQTRDPDAFAVQSPDGWAPVAAGAAPLEVFGVPFTPLTEVPAPEAVACPSPVATQGVAASGLVAVPAGTSVEQAAGAFARGTGEAVYAGTQPQVTVGAPGPRPGSGAGIEQGTWVEATVHTDGTGPVAGGAPSPGCRATDAHVGVLAVPRTRAQDGSVGVAMLLVAADAAGGPGRPVPHDDLTRLASSAVPPR